MNMGTCFFSGEKEKPETGLFEYRWTHHTFVTTLWVFECQRRRVNLSDKCFFAEYEKRIVMDVVAYLFCADPGCPHSRTCNPGLVAQFRRHNPGPIQLIPGQEFLMFTADTAANDDQPG